MAFDAGSVDAKLTIDTSAFDRSLAKAKADVEKFERDGHKVKISAVFDSGSVGRARKMFADLDNSISRDAMNRLKSSPQGSVLGSLNALFSPHPVTGAPSPSQSAQGGLLGKMLSPEASGGGSGYGTRSSGSPLAGVLAQTADITDNVKTNLTGEQPGNVITQDKIVQSLAGTGAPRDTTTADTIRERVDPASEARAEADSAASGDRAGSSFGAMFLGRLKNLFPKSASDKLAADARKAGGGGGAAMGSGLLSGIGPGILGVGAKMAGIVGLAGSALGALPALAGVAGTGIGVALIGGITAKLAAANPQIKAETLSLFGGKNAAGKHVAGSLSGVFTSAFAPMVPAILGVLKQVTGLVKSTVPALTSIFKTIAPQIQGIFGGLKPVIMGLLGVMQAAAPAFGPFIMAIESLVGNILPGLAIVIKATVPFIRDFADILGSLGGSLGQLFATAAPAIGASMKILGGLLGLIGSLLPVVMRLADIFAVTLAPVFTAFASVVGTLLRPLTMIGGVIAQFAGAVVGDLAGAFGAVAALVKAIGPSLGVLAAAFGSLFTVLENAGVFALFGDALENIAPSLGKLIALLITDLAPILPMIVSLFSQLLDITVTLATDGLGYLVRMLLAVVQAIPPGVIQALVGGFIALKLVMMGFEGVGLIFGAVGAAVTGLETALMSSTAVAVASAVAQAAAWVAAGAVIVASFVAQAAAATVAFIAENAATLGIIAGIGLLVAGIIYLATHWHQVWGDIKNWTVDAWHFIDNILHNGIVNDVLAIVAPLAYLGLHWRQTWDDMKTAAGDFYTWLWTDFGAKIQNFFVNTIPNWLQQGVSGAALIWDGLENDLKTPVNWVLRNVIDPLFGAIDDVTSFVGMGSPLPRSLALSGGGKLPGYGGGDILPALLEPGEAVIDKDTTRKYAALFRMMGVPGFSLGGLPGGGVLHDIASAAGGALGDVGSFFAGLAGGGLDLTKIGLDLAHGDAGGAERALMSLLGVSGSGGAAGGLGKALLAMPGTMAMDAMKYLVDPVVKWVAGQSAQVGNVGSGVQRWAGTVLQALKMEGLPAGDLSLVLRQIGTESGGNPDAINLWDSNAKAGDPSRGLLQTIMTTFQAYHWPGTSDDIYNPLANIAAALNYASHAPGVGIGPNPGQLGGGSGYARGGLISEPVIGYGVNSGRVYTLGEQGPEWVTPVRGGGSGGMGAGGPSQLADSISIMMPEGSTVAAALTELTWYLQASRMQAAH